MTQQCRVIAYVDGFNLYHTVRYYKPNKVDLWSLFESLNQTNEELVAVKYFSAYAQWLPRKTTSHKRYVKDLEATGVVVKLGQYKKKGPKGSWEEKETDINIALRMVMDAEDDLFDRAKLLTVDSDLVSAVKELKERKPEKQVLIVKPPGRSQYGRELVEAAGGGRGFNLDATRVKRHMFRASARSE